MVRWRCESRCSGIGWRGVRRIVSSLTGALFIFWCHLVCWVYLVGDREGKAFEVDHVHPFFFTRCFFVMMFCSVRIASYACCRRCEKRKYGLVFHRIKCVAIFREYVGRKGGNVVPPPSIASRTGDVWHHWACCGIKSVAYCIVLIKTLPVRKLARNLFDQMFALLVCTLGAVNGISLDFYRCLDWLASGRFQEGTKPCVKRNIACGTFL